LLIADEGPKPLCEENEDIFFGPDVDGRKEIARAKREELCKAICRECVFRVRCLERALVHGDAYGVWGGMGEGERREFARHIKDEGYTREIPTGKEFYASLREFTRLKREREQAA
jgi:hypothetical protein